MDRKKLIDYLPPFMQQFVEMQEIMKSVNISTDVIDKDIENTWNNAFILDADETGISRYEEFLNIVPLPSSTLEARRKSVLAAWNTYNIFTLKTLKKKLEQYCGEGNYKICDDTDLVNYFIHIAISADDVSISELKKYLEVWLPAHLQRCYEFDFKNNKKEHFAFVTVFKTHLYNQTQSLTGEEGVIWYTDEDGNILVDEYGNIIGG